MWRSVLAGWVAVASLALAAPAPKAEPKPYYATHVGDRLVYEKTSRGQSIQRTEEVTTVEDKDGVLYVTRDVTLGDRHKNTSLFEVSSNGVVCRALGGRDLPTPLTYLKLPAKVGSSWTVQWVGPKGEKADAKEFEITAVDERVEVPAGRFTAVRFEVIIGAGPGQTTITSWYAPRVGLVKQVNKSPGVEQVQVLKSFTPGN